MRAEHRFLKPHNGREGCVRLAALIAAREQVVLQGGNRSCCDWIRGVVEALPKLQPDVLEIAVLACNLIQQGSHRRYIALDRLCIPPKM